MLRLSDLSTDEDDAIHCRMNKYEKKIDSLMNVVGTLKNEVRELSVCVCFHYLRAWSCSCPALLNNGMCGPLAQWRAILDWLVEVIVFLNPTLPMFTFELFY